MKKVLFAWSGGKDSALALYVLRQQEDVEVVGLLTTVTQDYDRISMHGVQVALLERQAESVGLPLIKVFITKNSSNEDYESAMREALEKQRAIGVSAVAFGDIFLEDLRKHREEKLALVDMQGLFPLWKRDTTELAREFIALGFKAIVTCADSQAVSGTFAGRSYDEQLLADLPPTADPCFENGECHSFVYDGPIFRDPIAFSTGEIVLRDERFWYCDLIPRD
ncbi:MAG: diphthine--ammonia ligase [Armatimonadota bacterium]|nr:diphthine--ammonia ligase [Armatimonadota bacterium]